MCVRACVRVRVCVCVCACVRVCMRVLRYMSSANGVRGGLGTPLWSSPDAAGASSTTAACATSSVGNGVLGAGDRAGGRASDNGVTSDATSGATSDANGATRPGDRAEECGSSITIIDGCFVVR